MTSLDELVGLVNSQSEVSLAQAVKSLGIEEKDVLELAKILQEHDIVRIHYTVVGDIVLQKGKKLEVSKDVGEEIRKIEGGKESAEVDNMLRVIRSKIFEKKYGMSKKK